MIDSTFKESASEIVENLENKPKADLCDAANGLIAIEKHAAHQALCKFRHA